ncbi:hypothetical protein BIW11_05235 [Tropilaelaps mercedesae]|uniref:Secreted protein n=1 Tax=Tropilaelaps mercedesae TaxID=418985 RepID=A0A1V9Y3B1_9ACAR|nr:hypothetical protein BIW11_05235 [Tropilaelaps mercedesae]
MLLLSSMLSMVVAGATVNQTRPRDPYEALMCHYARTIGDSQRNAGAVGQKFNVGHVPRLKTNWMGSKGVCSLSARTDETFSFYESYTHGEHFVKVSLCFECAPQ